MKYSPWSSGQRQRRRSGSLESPKVGREIELRIGCSLNPRNGRPGPSCASSPSCITIHPQVIVVLYPSARCDRRMSRAVAYSADTLSGPLLRGQTRGEVRDLDASRASQSQASGGAIWSGTCDRRGRAPAARRRIRCWCWLPRCDHSEAWLPPCVWFNAPSGTGWPTADHRCPAIDAPAPDASACSTVPVISRPHDVIRAVAIEKRS